MARDICVVDDCKRVVNARGYCQLHTQRMRRAGELIPGSSWTRCSVTACEEYSLAHSYCVKHYRAWKTYGDPLHREKGEHGLGTINGQGYRMMWVDGKPKLQHRIVMEQVLARRLKRHETVHHKNGDRLDNRPENLELWVGKHPPGQRDAHCPTCRCFD